MLGDWKLWDKGERELCSFGKTKFIGILFIKVIVKIVNHTYFRIIY